MKRVLTRLAVLGFIALALEVPARAHAATPAAEVLMEQLESADPTLQTYRARVEFSVVLHTFPFLRKTLHGDAYFKRPSRMEIVFTDLPGFARQFRNLYVGLGTPGDWERKFDIETGETAGADGTRSPYLIMMPRKPDRRLRHVDVFIDAASGLPNRIVWTYRDGSIEMRQQIVALGGHHVVGAQNADIRLPGVHAYVNAKIENYAINVPVDDAVFTKRPAPSSAP